MSVGGQDREFLESVGKVSKLPGQRNGAQWYECEQTPGGRTNEGVNENFPGAVWAGDQFRGRRWSSGQAEERSWY